MRRLLLLLLLSCLVFASGYQSYLFNCVVECCGDNGGTVNYSDSGTPYCTNLTPKQETRYEQCGAVCSGQGQDYSGHLLLLTAVELIVLLVLGVLVAVYWLRRRK